jgi:pimeloyl-ACP methyl ester carboxylesterase
VAHWRTDGGEWTSQNLAAKAAFRQFSTAPRGPNEREAEAKLVEKLGPLLVEAESYRFGTPDTFVQAYLWRANVSPHRGRALLIHGWTGQALIMGLFVKPLIQAGFDVVAIDLPAHGMSGGRLLNMPIGTRAVLATAQHLGPFTGIITHSFGGQLAALALEGGPPIDQAMTTDRLVMVAAPHSLQRLAQNFGRGLAFPADLQARFEAKISAAASRPVETIYTGALLAAATCPVLAIHDTEDEEVPFSEAEAIAAACPRVTIMPMTGLGHRRIIVTSAVIRAAVRFLAADN